MVNNGSLTGSGWRRLHTPPRHTEDSSPKSQYLRKRSHERYLADPVNQETENILEKGLRQGRIGHIDNFTFYRK